MEKLEQQELIDKLEVAALVLQELGVDILLVLVQEVMEQAIQEEPEEVQQQLDMIQEQE